MLHYGEKLVPNKTRHLHYLICKVLGILRTEKWQTNTPKPVSEHEDVMELRRTYR